MHHFSCDLCGKNLPAAGAGRYVVKVEAFAADPGRLTDADLDADHVDEMARLLTELEDAGETPDLPPAARQQMQFDLCSACYPKFLADPLGREAAAFDFSPN